MRVESLPSEWTWKHEDDERGEEGGGGCQADCCMCRLDASKHREPKAPEIIIGTPHS